MVFRLGSHIPVPGIDTEALKSLLMGSTGTTDGGMGIYGFLDLLSGGAFTMATIFAMSIQPYITASIIMQLLTVAIPKLEQMAKEGEEGRKKIGQWVRYSTVVLAFLQASGLYFGLRGAMVETGLMSYLIVTLSFTAGTAFLMWLGEQITEYGIGNGISLLIFAGIVSRAPLGLLSLYEMAVAGKFGNNFVFSAVSISLIFTVFIGMVTAVVFVQEAERRIPVQYAKRVVGQKMYGGQKSHIPIKVNLAGVIPIIFAMSFVAFPPTLVGFLSPNTENWFLLFILRAQGSLWFVPITALLVVLFTFFYTAIQFNPIEIANNLKKNAGYIPGIRPGKPTSEYIMKVLNRITWFSAFFLALVTVFPSLVATITGITGVWFAGTGLLILVGVALDTVKQIESQMLMRNYKGFLE
jgi:preprotein translocase subunit SecY